MQPSAVLFLALRISFLSSVLPFHSFFHFQVVGVLCEAEKCIGHNCSSFTAPAKEGNHFSLLAIRLKDRNFTCRQMRTRTYTHTHKDTLTCTHTGVYIKMHTPRHTDPCGHRRGGIVALEK